MCVAISERALAVRAYASDLRLKGQARRVATVIGGQRRAGHVSVLLAVGPLADEAGGQAFFLPRPNKHDLAVNIRCVIGLECIVAGLRTPRSVTHSRTGTSVLCRSWWNLKNRFPF